MQQNVGKETQPLIITKTISQPEQSEVTTKNVNGFTHRKFRMLERAHVKEKW